MRSTSGATVADGDDVRPALGVCDNVGERPVWPRGMGANDVRSGADEQHRIEVLLSIERQVRNKKRIDGLAVEAEQPRRAVGRRLRDKCRSGAAGGARPVVYDDDVAQTLLQTGLNDPRNHVDRAAGRERDHNPDRAGRPRGGLPGGHARSERRDQTTQQDRTPRRHDKLPRHFLTPADCRAFVSASPRSCPSASPARGRSAAASNAA